MYVTGLNPIPGFDWTPVLFVFTGLIITFGIVRYRMFDLVPFSRNKLIETMDDGVLVINSEGFIEDCNSSVYSIFNLPETSILRKPFKPVFSGYNSFTEEIEKETNHSFDIEIKNKKESRHYQIQTTPVYDRKNKFSGHFIQIHDITSRKIAENKLKDSNRQLIREIEKREKLIEDLDAFSYTVAHDLKNSLGSVYSSTEILEEGIEEQDLKLLSNITGVIKDTAGKAIHITKELLLLAKVSHQEMELKPLDMKAIIEEAQERLQQMIDESGAEVTVAGLWPQVLGHAPWIEEVWVNYLSNAIKYGGTPPKIEIGAEPINNESIKFWIKDNGKGLTKAEQLKLFTMYTRLDPEKAEGSGLGLAIVKRIIDKMGGSVGVESDGKNSKGSLFFFTLPRN